MKKKLALLLVLVMLLGSLFSVVPMAEDETDSETADTGRYVPEIKYANVNYLNSIQMMFAIPVTDALADGESLKIIFWNSREASVAFSYNDLVKDILEAEEATVTINGEECLVYKYSNLSATEMTKNICVRPVVIDSNGTAKSYGKLLEYSVLEYVETAKGNIDGIDGIDNEEVIDLLDNMLEFGTTAQRITSKIPPLYYPNDDVNKIYATAMVNGINKGRNLSGFFKYEEGGRASFIAPFFDGVKVSKITDLEGNEIEDIDVFTDGLQFESVDSDLEFVVHYVYTSVRTVSAEAIGAGVEVNNYDDPLAMNSPDLVKKKSDVSYSIGTEFHINTSGKACQLDKNNRMNYWHSIKTVVDPSNPDNLVFQLTATGSPALNLANLKPADFQGVGFGDTLYPAFTFEITLGAVNGKMPTTGNYYFRHRLSAEGLSSSEYADLHIFLIRGGKVMLYDTDSNYNNNIVVGEIPATGMRKFAITVDALTGMTYGYAENLETGVMENTSESKINLQSQFLANQQKYFEDPVANSALACYESIYTFFTKAKSLEPIWTFGPGVKQSDEFENSSIKIDGVDTPLFTGEYNEEGKKIFNMAAVKALAERDYSFLLDDFKLTMGAIYQ